VQAWRRSCCAYASSGGDHTDVTYEEPDTASEEEVAEHAIAILTGDAGVLRSVHGDRPVVIFGRGVARRRTRAARPGAVTVRGRDGRRAAPRARRGGDSGARPGP